MSAPERWSRIEALYHAARDRDADQRAVFLDGACAGDAQLRRDVESLLAQPASGAGFLSEPAVAVGAEMITNPGATVLTGRRLGVYQIQALIDAGGMGEVYLATDTKLGRDVAIKILPRVFIADPDRLVRFEREARMLAALNHPHIGAIHGFEEAQGIRALVLELVGGETLAERIARAGIKGLPIKDALDIARQIADALDAAHEKGIVHRDLKPANIKITPQGVVKVLDFGLAKLDSRAVNDGATASATITIGATHEGLILGTAAYMSPEQARGHKVDKRTDIWAFGCLLYEMLTGRVAFFGQTVSDTLARVLERQPDLSALPPSTPPTVVTLLRRCLEKDARRRLRDIGDVRLELDVPLTGSGWVSPSHFKSGRTMTLLVVMAALAVGAAGALSVRRAVDSPRPTSAVRRVTVPTASGAGWGETALLGTLRSSRSLAMSPDGTRLVYVGISQGASRLYLRSLDQSDARILDGTTGASAPFWSPDGQWIAFFAWGQLRKIPAAGGAATTICAAPDNRGGSSGAWGTDGTIVFALPVSSGAGLMRVSAAGGTPEVLTRPDSEEEGGHGDPAFTADGRAILFTTRQIRASAPSIMVRSLVTREMRKLVDGASRPLHTASGHLVFGRGTTLFAAQFDIRSLQVTSPPVPVEEGVVAGQIDVSKDGVIAFIAEPRIDGRSLVWVDRSGTALGVSRETRGFTRPRLSPDERSIAVEVSKNTADSAIPGSSVADIWVYHLDNGAFTRLTDTGRSNSPFWTPDGKRIVYRTGGSIIWQAADGTGMAEPLVEPTDPELKSGSSLAPGICSPDGKSMLFVVHTSVANGADIWSLSLDSARKLRPVVQRPGNQWGVRVSPDSRWISYASDESGRFEVYVEPIGGGPRQQVSVDGGEQAVWSPKRDELFYRIGDRMMASAVKLSPSSFTASRPQLIFQGHYVATDLPAYDVTRDGRRFLMVRPSDDELHPAEISLVEGWFAKLQHGSAGE